MSAVAERQPRLHWSASAEDVARFHEDGFLIVPELFDRDEADLLHKIAKADPNGQPDENGAPPRMWLLGSKEEVTEKQDIWNGIVHSKRVVEAMMAFLGDEVYVYHFKMAMKEAANSEAVEGGRSNDYEWHQDYGYWYGSGALYADFASCFVAVDATDTANGCLKVIKGSHKLGRLDHGSVDGQHGAEPERVARLLDQGFEVVDCVLPRGGGVFFHCNTLHSSDINASPNPRWGLICCYNTKSNGLTFQSSATGNHLSYDRVGELAIWDDSELMRVGQQHWAELSGRPAL